MVRIALMLGIMAIVSNIILLTISGVPLSIVFGIMAIACALTTAEDKKLPRMSRAAVICAAIGLFFGFLIYFLLFLTTQALSDPATSHEVLEQMREIIGELPEGWQQNFHTILK